MPQNLMMAETWPSGDMVLDHDYESGLVRGLLYTLCGCVHETGGTRGAHRAAWENVLAHAARTGVITGRRRRG